MIIVASAITGSLAAWLTARATAFEPIVPPDRIEERRRDRLTRRSRVYRWCPHGVAWLAATLRPRLSRSSALQANLRGAGEDDWTPEEYVACQMLPASVGLIVLGVVVHLIYGPWLALVGVAVAVFALPSFARNHATGEATKRTDTLRDDLPFALDLMALVLEAGDGTLDDALRVAAGECRGRPLGEELNRILTALATGRTVPHAFGEFRDRVRDGDVAAIARDFIAADGRGVRPKENLRDLAARLRLLRSQWQEKRSEEAKVHIVWPTMLVLAGCLLIVAVPFVLGINL